MTEYHYLVVFNCGDIEQFESCNCLLNRLWHEFQNWHYLSNNAVVSTWLESQDKNSNILRTERAFLDELKSIFHHLRRAIIEANNNFFFARWDSDFKYKYCNIGRHVFLYILILTSIFVVLQWWSHSHILTFCFQHYY